MRIKTSGVTFVWPLALCLGSACAPPAATPAPPPLMRSIDPTAVGPAPVGVETTPARFQIVDRDAGYSSILLLPTVVDSVVAIGPLARSRVSFGALFATHQLAGRRVAAVGVVVQTVGGGLGPSLSVAPRIVVEVDGDVVARESLRRRGVYDGRPGRFGPEERLTVRVPIGALDRIAHGGRVTVTLGDGAALRLGDAHKRHLADFLSRIPADTHFGSKAEAAPVPGWRSE